MKSLPSHRSKSKRSHRKPRSARISRAMAQAVMDNCTNEIVELKLVPQHEVYVLVHYRLVDRALLVVRFVLQNLEPTCRERLLRHWNRLAEQHGAVTLEFWDDSGNDGCGGCDCQQPHQAFDAVLLRFRQAEELVFAIGFLAHWLCHYVQNLDGRWVMGNRDGLEMEAMQEAQRVGLLAAAAMDLEPHPADGSNRSGGRTNRRSE